MFTTLSSTLFLNIITGPYVTVLSQKENTSLLKARKLNIMGNPNETEFNLSEVTKVSGSVHPFASFKAKNRYFYVFGKNVECVKVRRELTNES